MEERNAFLSSSRQGLQIAGHNFDKNFKKKFTKFSKNFRPCVLWQSVAMTEVFQKVRYRQRLGNGEGTGMGIGKHIPHLELLVIVKGGVIALR